MDNICQQISRVVTQALQRCQSLGQDNGGGKGGAGIEGGSRHSDPSGAASARKVPFFLSRRGKLLLKPGALLILPCSCRRAEESFSSCRWKSPGGEEAMAKRGRVGVIGLSPGARPLFPKLLWTCKGA